MSADHLVIESWAPRQDRLTWICTRCAEGTYLDLPAVREIIDDRRRIFTNRHPGELLHDRLEGTR
ncbi:MAG: hypothetical protein WC986_13735 [Elusimicrobiota bacterium]|jgi:hypothetical protein